MSTKKQPAKFTEEERAAMEERSRELKKKPGGEAEVLARIAAMSAADRLMAARIHAIVKSHAPHLVPRTWYGMPAYAKDGEVICFFQSADKFKTRYSTFGFSDKAKLDQGSAWPVAFALRELNAETEALLGALIQRAAA